MIYPGTKCYMPNYNVVHDYLTPQEWERCCPETSVINCEPTARNTTEERRLQLHRGGSLRSRM
jgi:hypothetical protein